MATLRRLSILALALTTATTPSQGQKNPAVDPEGRCVTYGLCTRAAPGDKVQLPGGKVRLPCLDPDPTPGGHTLENPVEDEELLLQACPHFADYFEEGKELRVCCSSEQLKVVARSYSWASPILGRCSSCMANFRKNYCDMLCRPDQSTFVEAETVEESDITGQQVVSSVNYYLHPEHANGTFESCKNVQQPSTNTYAIGFFCGQWGARLCDYEKLYGYLAFHAPGVVLGVNYKFGETEAEEAGMVRHNPPTTKCNVGVYGNAPCSCTDCPSACSYAPVFASDPEPWTVFGDFDMLTFIMIWIFVTGTGLFLLGIFLGARIMKAWPGKESDSAPITTPDGSAAPALTLSDLHPVDRLGVRLHLLLARSFTWWGTFVARWPAPVMLVSFLMASSCFLGFLWLEVTSDPVQMWAGPQSRSRLEKQYFDETFRPFYRAVQVIVRAKDLPEIPFTDEVGTNHTFGPIFNREEFMLPLLDLQEQIVSLRSDNNVTLDQVCNKPLGMKKKRGDGVKNCLVQGLWGYYKDRRLNVMHWPDNFYLQHFLTCSRNPTILIDKPILGCLNPLGVPIQPFQILGGFIPEGQEGLGEDPEYTRSTATSINIILDNYDAYNEDPEVQEQLAKAKDWEKTFIDFMKGWESDPANANIRKHLDVAFFTERSVEDELNRMTQGDVMTITTSNLIMFLYITMSLGQVTEWRRALIETKLTLGIGGVFIVLFSVVASVGFLGLVGMKSTMISFEIIPFLVLAIGVDNIFILVQTYQRKARLPTEIFEEHIGRVIGEVGPSMLLSSVAEATCFFLGAYSSMPAVYSFAINAGWAIVIDFFMQITCFVGLMTLDLKRQENNRYDIICCVRASKKGDKPKEGLIYKLFDNFFAPFILGKWVRPVIMVVFFGWLCTSLSVAPKVDIGLEQDISMPDDSYVRKLFDYQRKYLSVGPPLYIVVDNKHLGFDFTDQELQNRLCGSSGCNDDSLQSQVRLWSAQPEKTRIACPAQSWIDEFFVWSTDMAPRCCNYKSHFQPGNRTKEVCTGPLASVKPLCRACEKHGKFGRPTPEDMNMYIGWFREDVPNPSCPVAGRGAYYDALRFKDVSEDYPDDGFTYNEITASNFMSFHTILKNSHDFTDALRNAWELTDSISEKVNKGLPEEQRVRVFPYSVFYVYYEQYLNMWQESLKTLAMSIAAIFFVTFVFSGLDLPSATISVMVIFMIIANMMGMMYWWGIQLNGVTLANLIVSVGISVETCAHMCRSFAMTVGEDKVDRARKVLTSMGSTVLAGVHLTNFAGIIVLAFAVSPIFQIFFFRVYLGLVLIGAAHGLILLPALLSYVGPGMKRALVLQTYEPNELGISHNQDSRVKSAKDGEYSHEF